MLRPLTDQEKKDALDRALAARDRGIVEKPKTRRRRERAKVLRVTVRDAKRESQ